jgi:hypothetical protein
LSDTNDAADFAAALRAAASAAEETPDATESKSDEGDVADTSDSTSADSSDAEGEGADADDADGAGDDDGQAEDDEDDAAVSSDVEAIRQKFIDGDIEDALKDLGVDPKVLGVNGPKLIAMRKGLAEAKNLKARADQVFKDAAAKEVRAQDIIKDGKAQYGHLVDLKNALKLGEYTAARDILEALAPDGVTYKQIAEGLAKAAAGMSPSEVIYRKKLRELAEKERKDAEDAEASKAKANQPAPEAVRAKNLEGAAKLLKGSALEGIPGAAEKIVELAAANWDAEKKGLKVPKTELVKLAAKDPVIAQLLELKQLKAKGKGKAPAPEPKVEREKGTGKFRSRRTETVDPNKKEKDEFAAAMAQAAAMEAADRRRAGAGKGRR